MTNYFTVPGLGGSNEKHWQTYFERTLPNCVRIEQEDWNTPKCQDWVENIDNALSNQDLTETILVAHSLGCIAIAHWAKKYQKPLKAALLVVPPNIEEPYMPFDFSTFLPIPLDKLPFKTTIVASTKDPWISLDKTYQYASHWGSEVIEVGEAGHINVSAGFGEWPRGIAILKTLG